jgi:Domain of unknown function (DUF5667)
MSPSLGQTPEPLDQDVRLAELLDTCLRAERGAPGSAPEIVSDAPEELRGELLQLLDLARVLEAASRPSATAEFRAGAQARFHAVTQPAVARRAAAPVGLRSARPWLGRLAAGLATVVLASYGSVRASAGSLPGQPLYAVKQADEFVTLGLTRDDLSRAFVLLDQAGARLDEATRLAGAAQVQAAGDLLQQYVVTLERATATFSRAQGADPRRGEFDAQLQVQFGQLESLARDAPQPLRPGIQQAQTIVTRELGHSPRPSGTPSGAPSSSPQPATLSPSSAASPGLGAVPPAPASPPPVSAPIGRATPAETVQSFYRLVAEERGGEAAQLWTPRLRAAFPPAESITARFSHTRALVLERADVVALDDAAGTATVAVTVREELDGPPGERRYTGTWDLVRTADGWLLDQPDLRST